MAERKKLPTPTIGGSRPVTKAEFVGLMVLLGKRDRAKYRELREQGWAGAIPPESELPN